MRSDNNVDIFFLGDTYFGEWHMRLRSKKGKEDILAQRGYTLFGKNFEDILADADEVIANLECSITDIKRSPLADTAKGHIYAAEERGTIEALKKLHISTCMLANNHAVDYGKAGLIDTINALERAGIKYIGGGRFLQEAQDPLYFEKKCTEQTFRAAIVSTYNFGKKSQEYGFYAEDQIPGVNQQKLSRIAQQVKEYKAKHPEGLFILSPHWGANYVWRSFRQQKQAEELINAGVDLIVGHSAHMIQETEYYKNKLVLYSIGNFIMNGDGEYKRRRLPPYSFIARLHISEKDSVLEKKMILYPFVCDNLATDFNPRFVNEKEFEHVRAILRSHEIDTDIFDASVHCDKDQYGYFFSYAL